MILYTTMPQELIFQTEQTDYDRQMVIQYDGIPLLVQMDDNHDYRVIQVMSSDPSHFLDGKYTPGTVLSMRNF